MLGKVIMLHHHSLNSSF